MRCEGLAAIVFIPINIVSSISGSEDIHITVTIQINSIDAHCSVETSGDIILAECQGAIFKPGDDIAGFGSC